MFDDGFFGDLFDFDGDGKLDSFEQAVDFGAFMSLMEDDDDIGDFDFDED